MPIVQEWLKECLHWVLDKNESILWLLKEYINYTGGELVEINEKNTENEFVEDGIFVFIGLLPSEYLNNHIEISKRIDITYILNYLEAKIVNK